MGSDMFVSEATKINTSLLESWQPPYLLKTK